MSFRITLGRAAVMLGLGLGALAGTQAAEIAGMAASADAEQMLQWVRATQDHHGLPFAIVDKKAAAVFIFDAQAHPLGAAPVLLGEMPGDQTVPGVGDKPPSQVLPEERTTPAGRFASEPGRNLGGDTVVWVDYDSGFAIHRVRPGASHAGRMKRLLSASPAAHRASLGCVVVSSSFFDNVVAPTLASQPGVVYVLPETRPVQSLFRPEPVVTASR
jgi:hypothetical protein